MPLNEEEPTNMHRRGQFRRQREAQRRGDAGLGSTTSWKAAEGHEQEGEDGQAATRCRGWRGLDTKKIPHFSLSLIGGTPICSFLVRL